MAYRRRQGITRATTFKEEIYNHRGDDFSANGNVNFRSSHSFSSNSSLAAQAIRASASHRDPPSQVHSFNAFEDASKNESRGFWGILAQKAKAILEDDDVSQQFGLRSSSTDGPRDAQSNLAYPSNDGFKKVENPTLRKSLDKLTSSLTQIGDTFEKAFEEGRTIVENKTADIIQETRKLQIRQKGAGIELENQTSGGDNQWQLNQTNHESQLKASRDVAMATAAKAKLLLRELKTVKADLAFAKERCAQLEEENRRLRDSREKGSNAADDDLIRLQLETLLAEKARLAHENSIYARENRFLREIVEYHQLTMQDVVYIDEGIEEVAEVNPSISRTLSVTSFSPSHSNSPSSPTSPSQLPITKEIEIYPLLLQQTNNDDDGNDTIITQLTAPPSLPDPIDTRRSSSQPSA